MAGLRSAEIHPCGRNQDQRDENGLNVAPLLETLNVPMMEKQERGDNRLIMGHFPPSRVDSGASGVISAAHTSNSFSPLWVAIKLSRDAPQWNLGNYHCHGDKKGSCPRAQCINMSRDVIHKKKMYKNMGLNENQIN